MEQDAAAKGTRPVVSTPMDETCSAVQQFSSSVAVAVTYIL